MARVFPDRSMKASFPVLAKLLDMVEVEPVSVEAMLRDNVVAELPELRPRAIQTGEAMVRGVGWSRTRTQVRASPGGSLR